MKTDFSINVQVSLGVTQEVVELVNAILNRDLQVPATTQVHDQPTEQVMANAEAEAEPAEQPAPAEVEEDKPRDTAFIREVIHRTRQRIEGEDYKEHTDGELYKKYHRALTATFKQISAVLGANVPSQLPAEQYDAFAKECDQLQVLEDGTIGKPIPF